MKQEIISWKKKGIWWWKAQVCMALNYIEQLLILVSVITGCVSVSVLALLVSILAGISSSLVLVKTYAIAAGIKKYKSIIKKKKKNIMKWNSIVSKIKIKYYRSFNF